MQCLARRGTTLFSVCILFRRRFFSAFFSLTFMSCFNFEKCVTAYLNFNRTPCLRMSHLLSITHYSIGKQTGKAEETLSLEVEMFVSWLVIILMPIPKRKSVRWKNASSSAPRCWGMKIAHWGQRPGWRRQVPAKRDYIACVNVNAKSCDRSFDTCVWIREV